MAFDPSAIAPFTVFRCDYRFSGDPEPEPARRFICLQHRSAGNQKLVISLKATSKVEAYRNNPKRLQGVLLYEAGAIPCFEKATVVQTKLWPIDYFHLIKEELRGNFLILGMMPSDFPEALAKAVRSSVELNRSEKARIFELLGARE